MALKRRPQCGHGTRSSYSGGAGGGSVAMDPEGQLSSGFFKEVYIKARRYEWRLDC